MGVVEMAGASAKKNAASNVVTLAFRFNIMCGVLAWFALYRIAFHWESFTFYPCALFGVATAGVLMSYGMFKSIANGDLYDLSKAKEVGPVWFDLFYVSLFILTVAAISDWLWFLYLVVPLYAIYAVAIKPCLDWVLDGDNGETEITVNS